MRIRKQDSTEGIIINAYECDNCPDRTIDSVLPKDWLDDGDNTHYCAVCSAELED